LADALHIRFEWDDAKSDRCVRDRGFGADILPAFLDPQSSVERDARRDYGEERFRLTVESPDDYSWLRTRRGAVTRIISARKANSGERDRHGAD
jgi:uncharacterized DUF497 family protein